ncbi:putative nadh-dependent flavin oxidoreductase protein [Botrytis fragariae]|uniref:Putative nadh-dependent flavin oxidoreductase protein n=1 Tax=Botrytis fragariae TaxID=1964551 RepID=A0A8H6AMU1_9HELO|nr:putative nadh-dependent flavin oxidoreductase protein [Botrytis fragariae]KAF5870274.1 putative nadh-dependent flavin oxidoreductase protein [Botrytis fragariae]
MSTPTPHPQHGVPCGTSTPRPGLLNTPAPGPLLHPSPKSPSGTALHPSPSTPKLFTPLKIRSLTLQNRIMLSPMCQYSASNGHFTPWHMAHLGGIISRGPGLSMVEATAVLPEGRITPEDSGLWLDSQGDKLKEIVQFAHSQGQLIGIQLSHAGRKASMVAPWLDRAAVATEDAGGWPTKVKASSALPFDEHHCTPSAMTLEDIQEFKDAWAASVKRALRAGFDVIEIHNAHGYLLHEFVSPVSNKRNDMYGGGFENRIRLTLEIVEVTRSIIPEGMPLFLRISATDCLDYEGFEEESWTVRDSARLAGILADRGVDLMDISSGANHPKQRITAGLGYQAPFAKEIKRVVGERMLVGTVGMIGSGEQAERLLSGRGGERGVDEDVEGGEEGTQLDLVIVARGFQKNPGLVWEWAEELGVRIMVAHQMRWGFRGKAGGH